MGCGLGVTCWRQLHEWHQAGAGSGCTAVLLDRLGNANAINWDRMAVDSDHTPAKDNLLKALVDALLVICQCAGRPWSCLAKLHANKGYNFAHCRQPLRRRAIIPRTVRYDIESSEHFGRHRWEVKLTLAWFARFRRFAVRYERRAGILTVFHQTAASLICWRFAQRRSF